MDFNPDYLWDLVRDFIPDAYKEDVAREWVKYCADEMGAWDLIQDWENLLDDAKMKAETLWGEEELPE